MAESTADRNMLFGILALQLDFIDRAQLIAAMQAWVLDKSEPLDEILAQRGDLSQDRQALLKALVQEHLKQHGDDLQKSLASVSGIGSVGHDLRQLGDVEIDASLAHVPLAKEQSYSTQPVSVGASSSEGERFRILRPYARGGLGQVWVARDEELHREVALKELQQSFADDHDKRQRFVVEAEVTGALEHPGIVPVYGLGHYSNGRPFYAMRFVRGDSLKEAIARFHDPDAAHHASSLLALELRKLLGRFVDVCQAIEYAHNRGVLHRDLKPGNIMLGKYGETLVIDWGLAKPLAQPDTAGPSEEAAPPSITSPVSDPTLLGSAVGTPAYMSPEQAAGRLDELGPSSDIYSLGATLYTLLTGHPPIEASDVGEILRQAERGAFPRPRQVNPQVPAPLEAICLKAMSRHPKDRYESAAQLADDVEHWLGDEAVAAYRDPLVSQLARWSRRHKAAVASAAVLLLTALVGVSIGAVLLGDANRRVQQQRDVAQANAESARQQSELADRNAQLAADHARAAATNAQKAEAEAAVAQAAQQREAELRITAERQARVANALRLAAQSEAELEKFPQRSLLLATEAIQVTTRAGEPPTPRAEQALRGALGTMSGESLGGNTAPIRQMVLSGDGRFAATCDDQDAVRLWDLNHHNPSATCKVIFAPPEGQRFFPTPSLVTSPDGRWLAAGGPVSLLSLWNLTAEETPGEPARVLCSKSDSSQSPAQPVLTSLIISPDSRWLVCATKQYSTSIEGVVVLCDLHAPQPLKSGGMLRDGIGRHLDLHLGPDGRRLITRCDGERQFEMWDITSETPRANRISVEMGTAAISQLQFSGNGDRMVIVDDEETCRWWDLSAGDPSSSVKVLTENVPSDALLAISPDGRWLAVSVLNALTLWDMAAATPVATSLRGHMARVSSLAITPNGNWLVTASQDSNARLWNLTGDRAPEDPVILRGHDNQIHALQISPDGRWLVTLGDDQTARVWDLEAKDPAARADIMSGADRWHAVARFSPDSRWLAVAGLDGVLRVRDFQSENPGQEVTQLRGFESPVQSVTFSANSRRIAAVAGSDMVPRVWDLRPPFSGTEPQVVPDVVAIDSQPSSLQWCMSGNRTRTEISEFCLWNVSPGKNQCATIPQTFSHVQISSDNRWLVAANDGEDAQLWNLERVFDEPQSWTLRGHEHRVSEAEFSRDGRWLVTRGAAEEALLLWRLTAQDPSADPLLLSNALGPTLDWPRIRQSSQGPRPPSISPNSRWMFTNTPNGLELWDLTQDEPSGEPAVTIQTDSFVDYAVYSSDSRWLVCVSSRREVQCWDLTTANGPQGHQVQTGQVNYQQTVRVLLSPDSQWLAVATAPETRVKLWALPAQQWSEPRYSLDGHEQLVTDLMFSPDSRWLVSLSADRTTTWDLSAENPGASPRECSAEPPPTELLEFSHDSQRLTTASERKVHLWRMPRDQQSPIVREGEDLHFLVAWFSANDRWLVTDTESGSLELRDLQSASLESHPIQREGDALEISDDGRWLYIAPSEETQKQQRVQAWLLDLNSEDPARDPVTLTGDGRPALLTGCSADFSWLAIAPLWDTQAEETHMWVFRRDRPDLLPIARPAFQELLPQIEGVVAVSGDNRWLAAGVGTHEVFLWDLQRSDWDAAPVKLDLSGAGCSELMMDAAGRRLVVATDAGTVLAWSLDASGSASPLPPLGEQGELHSLTTLSPNGQWLVTVCNGNTAYAWNLTHPQPTESRVKLAHDPQLFYKASFSPDSRWLASEIHSDRMQLQRVSADGGLGEPSVLDVARASVMASAFGPDSHWFAAIGPGNMVHVYDLTAEDPEVNPKWTSPLQEHAGCLGFDSGGRWLAIGCSDATVRLWDLTSDDPAAHPRVLRGHDQPVVTLAFNPQGTRLATGESEGKVLLWDLRDESSRWSPLVLPDSTGGNTAPLLFSPDGAYLGKAGYSPIVVWNTDVTALMALAKRLAGRELTDREVATYMIENGKGE